MSNYTNLKTRSREELLCSMIPVGYSVILPLDSGSPLHEKYTGIIVRSTGIFGLLATSFPAVDEDGTIFQVRRQGNIWKDNKQKNIENKRVFMCPLLSMSSVGRQIYLEDFMIKLLEEFVMELKFPFLHQTLNKVWSCKMIEKDLDTYVKSFPKDLSLIFKIDGIYNILVVIKSSGIYFSNKDIRLIEDKSFQSESGYFTHIKKMNRENTGVRKQDFSLINTDYMPVLTLQELNSIKPLEEIMKFDFSLAILTHFYLSHFCIEEVKELQNKYLSGNADIDNKLEKLENVKKSIKDKLKER